MPTAIKMPQLGESVTEGTISKWLVRKGDKIQQYEPLAEVMTDKVNAEIPSSVSGVVTEITASEDESIKVGGTICIIETETTDNHQTKTSTQDPSQKKRYSPAVLRLAEEHKIDLHAIEGTGRDGRITRKDVLNELNREKVPSMKDLMEVKPVPRTIIEKKTEETTMETNDIVIPVTGVRKKIAENMVRSKHEIPHAWTMVEVDVTNLVKYRNEVKDSFKQKEGYTLTYLPFFIKAIVDALKEYPQINSTWTGDTIIQKKEINISLAVASEDALYVPVIKDADEKTVKGLAKKTNELARKVRTNTITSDDMQGGTFTVNNTGSFGSFLSAPIINYPQAAILSIESIVKRPIVLENDAIAIRHMVNLCLSLDHRILDGLICGRFLAKVKDNLEKISKETTPLY